MQITCTGVLVLLTFQNAPGCAQIYHQSVCFFVGRHILSTQILQIIASIYAKPLVSLMMVPGTWQSKNDCIYWVLYAGHGWGNDGKKGTHGSKQRTSQEGWEPLNVSLCIYLYSLAHIYHMELGFVYNVSLVWICACPLNPMKLCNKCG